MTAMRRAYLVGGPKGLEAAQGFTAASLRAQLQTNGWREQGEMSRCTSADGTLTTTWWNRGPAGLLLVEQEGVAYLAKLATTAKQAAGMLARKAKATT